MQRVLITGGTGTFGRACIRRLIRDNLALAVCSYSRDEYKIAALNEEFAAATPFKAFVGDVRDVDRLRQALRGVDTVIHAAALKRVDVSSYSPGEIIKTNVEGTRNVVDEAIAAGVERVVVISSDKAVAPINIYGASKYQAETYAVQANAYRHSVGKPRIAAVRYGNVLGSRGSVYHTWTQQIARGEPLTVTDARMSRFTMTIEQAVDLVLLALHLMRGGEVFIPQLPSAMMSTMAAATALRHGRDAYPIVYSGIRPGGEKLAEALLNEEETTRTRGPLRGQTGDLTAYAILPTHHEWTRDPWLWPGAGITSYRSDENERWLTVAALCALMDQTEACQ